MKAFLHRQRSFVILLSLLFFVRGTLADQYYIPSGSMEPGIAVGDRIFVNKLAYDIRLPFSDVTLSKTGEPERGDVIVFFHPENRMRMVKRLVGLPGDHIQIENGFVWVNGKALPGTDAGIREFLKSADGEITYTEKVGEHDAHIKRTHTLYRSESSRFTVPAGKYFAMGDNRDNSSDSRAWGFVPRDNIQGQALGVLFNFILFPFVAADLSRIAKPI